MLRCETYKIILNESHCKVPSGSALWDDFMDETALCGPFRSTKSCKRIKYTRQIHFTKFHAMFSFRLKNGSYV
jgi:hypothetical protein